ncbi:tol-pal system protein YbgF [Oxalicibacterium faecigallinarum]|uniref:Cell division coordinator CpoB n=1 Tax=Oxalicibacterium faecigallinarum TaxID=573741 RepID=A0A8J3AJN1_9BURK|nr:tol-pal system protein YbgF [Oxalicibacterium faecigallinarum]GGI15792.1 tol-pal system protein YbgF [Oxalicibacterium faecigallinarum]
MIKQTLAAALVAAFSLGSLPAHAQLFGGDNEARRAILDLRTKTDNLQQSKAESSALLNLQNQNDELRQEINRLNGQVEVLQNEVSNAQQRQKDLYVDLDNRLRKLEPQQIQVDGQDAVVQQSEQSAYTNAENLFRAGDYKGAAAAFTAFLQRYPDSAYAPSAQYWIGNAQYAQKDYRAAITSQQNLIKKYPDNPRAADAMLNIASSQMELKDRAAAKKALEGLVWKYPNSPAAQTARERLANLK